MSTPTLLGRAAPADTYTARYLRWGDHPGVLVAILRRIWAATFARDTDAMAAALLQRDWLSLQADTRRSRISRQPLIRGVGYPAPAEDPAAQAGALDEPIDGAYEWLYLLHTVRDVVAVYAASRHGRWLSHSIHRLDPAGPLFAPHTPPPGGSWRCTVCGAVDQIDHVEAPSMPGYGHDRATVCTGCGSVQTTDPMFGTHAIEAARRPGRPS